MAQLCGATAMKYYLPALLRALGVGTRLALMAGAVEMTVKVGLTVGEMWAIERLGRRACLVGGCLVMGVAMLVSGRRSMWFGLVTDFVRLTAHYPWCIQTTSTKPRMWCVSSSSSSTPWVTASASGLRHGSTAQR